MLVAGVLLRAPYPGWLAGMASVDAVARVGLGLWFLCGFSWCRACNPFVTTRIFVLVIVCLDAARAQVGFPLAASACERRPRLRLPPCRRHAHPDRPVRTCAGAALLAG